MPFLSFDPALAVVAVPQMVAEVEAERAALRPEEVAEVAEAAEAAEAAVVAVVAAERAPAVVEVPQPVAVAQ